jgi:hypothetical protein
VYLSVAKKELQKLNKCRNKKAILIKSAERNAIMPGGAWGSDITLRSEAERTLKSSMLPPEEMPTEDAQRLIHELRVHQIELEMQNEELRNIQTQLEESRARYADLKPLPSEEPVEA